jgi:long-chain acyl-CoA synthetase
MERTVNRLFRDSVERYPDNPMMWEKSGGAYKPTDYRTALRLVEETAAGLIRPGLGKGDRVTLLSEGRNTDRRFPAKRHQAIISVHY